MNDRLEPRSALGEGASTRMAGRIRPAPENALSAEELDRARRARRSFMGKALAMGAGAGAAARVAAGPTGNASMPREAAGIDGPGDKAILELPAHTTGLGQPVAARGDGTP